MRQKSRCNIFGMIGICLFGAVFALSVTAMIQSGHINLNCFYDVGEICDVACNDGGFCIIGMEYNAADNSYLIKEDTASKRYYIQTKNNNWNYAYLNVKLEHVTELKVTMQGYDADGSESYICDYTLVEGDNYISIGGYDMAQCGFLFENQVGAGFSITKLRFFEKEISVWGKKAWICVGILWIYFIFASAIFRRRQSGYFIRLIDTFIGLWQELFCICGEKACSFSRKYSKKQIHLLRTLLFLIFIWGGYYFFIFEIYQNNMNFVYLFGSVMSVLLAVFCLERKPEKLSWNQRLVYLWIIIWGISILSDLIVGKTNGEYLGFVMLGPVSFLFFAWHNMDIPEQLLDDFLDAVEISAWFRIFYAFFFDSFQPGVRYQGIDNNPGIQAMFLMLALVAFVSKMEKRLTEGTLEVCHLRYLAGIGIILQFFWKTQSITGLGTLALLGILYAGRFHLQRKFVWEKKRRIFLLVSIVIIVAAFFGTDEFMSRNEESAAQIVTVMEENPAGKTEWGLLSEPVYAKSLITGSRVYDKLVNITSMESLTTGRNLFWVEFLRSMNFFGNENKPYFWRGRHLGHNAILTMGNLYGVWIITPYTLLLIAVIYGAIKKVRIRSNYLSVFVFGCLFGGIVVSMGDNVEQPFLVPLWIALYLCIGSLFPDREKTISKNEIGSTGK